MNIEDLKTFLSVAKHASFSQAAAELHLTQPAISKRIAVVENRFGVRLFDRIGRQTCLTEAGHTLLIHARQVIHALEDGQRAIYNLSSEVGGSLKMATSHHISLHRLPSVLHDYTRRYPDVQLDLRFMDSEDACRAVEHAELDLALVTLPPADNTSLNTLEVWVDRLILAASPDHPLASIENIDAGILARYPAILPVKGTYTRMLIDQLLAGEQLETRLETHYLESIKMLVSAGLGWSMLPESMLETHLRLPQAQHIQAQRTLGIVSHPQRTLSNAATAFISLCQ